MAPKLPPPPAAWGQSYECAEPFQLPPESPARSRSRSPLRSVDGDAAAAAAASLPASSSSFSSSSSSQPVPSVSQTLVLPLGHYVVPRQVQTSGADNLDPGVVFFEARVPVGIMGPAKKSPGTLCVQLAPDAFSFWDARICKRIAWFSLGYRLGHVDGGGGCFRRNSTFYHQGSKHAKEPAYDREVFIPATFYWKPDQGGRLKLATPKPRHDNMRRE